ncbi:MAG: CPXCG motif-containing cysteine-rich protein [Chromatiales bacterium]
MREDLSERRFDCPYCGELISVVLDLSVSAEQDYIEDCEICCQPIHLRISVEEGRLCGFRYDRTD